MDIVLLLMVLSLISFWYACFVYCLEERPFRALMCALAGVFVAVKIIAWLLLVTFSPHPMY